MTYGDCIMAALGAIQANVLRSVLTALGIIIGVAAVIVMISVGAGAQKQVDDVIKKLGSNLVIVVPGTTTSGGARGARGSRRTLTEDDAIAIQNEVPTVKVSAPTVRGSGQIIFGNQNWSTVIRGVTPDYGQAREWEIADGRWFSNDEVRSAAKVALIGETVSESLFGNDNPVGQIIRIKRVPFTVIGTLVGKGETPMGNDMDDVVFIPLTTAKKRTLGGRRVSGRLVGVVFVKSNSAEVVDDTIRDMTKLLRLRHKIRLYLVFTLS